MKNLKDFDEYLQYLFMESEPESVGDKDHFQDNFDNWLTEQDPSFLIEIATKWGELMFLQGKMQGNKETHETYTEMLRTS